MRKLILLIFTAPIIWGCGSFKKKAYESFKKDFPEVYASDCAKDFPVKEIESKKEIEREIKIITIDGGKVECPPADPKQPQQDPVFVQCPPVECEQVKETEKTEKTVRDTAYEQVLLNKIQELTKYYEYKIEKLKEDQNKQYLEDQKELNKRDNQIEELIKDRDFYKSKANKRFWYLISIAAFFGLTTAGFVLYKLKKLPFI